MAGWPNREARVGNVEAGVQSAYRRSDLHDPVKRPAVIRNALAEVLERDVPAARKLTREHRAALIDWMAEDPLIQSRVTNHLERTLE
jgi:hypothetical protein